MPDHPKSELDILYMLKLVGKLYRCVIRTEKTQCRGKITNVKKTGPKK